MKKRKCILQKMLARILILGIAVTGCGAAEGQQGESVQNTGTAEMSGTRTPETAQSEKPDDAQTGADPEEETIDPNAVGKEIITLGRVGKIDNMDEISKSIYAFNQSQDKYFVEMKAYDDRSKFNLDITRKQGADIFDLRYVTAESLAEKGVLEDLAPYFEKSQVVGKDDILEAVWRAGTVGGKMVCVIPCFMSEGMIVEKGYTKDGGWTPKEYFDFGEQYPESMLNKYAQNPGAQIFTYLRLCIGEYIDWENKTCDFEGEDFKEILTMLKTLKDRKYEPVSTSYTDIAEMIHEKKYLTVNVQIGLDPQMVSYKNIMEAFPDDYEIAGMPTADGNLKYGMIYNEIYGMNAASENKEGAWAFLEYLLSEEYQQPSSTDWIQKSHIAGCFPARKDCLERGLQENVDYVPDTEKVHYRTNQYTGEKSAEYVKFTEEDKKAVYNIVDNTYRVTFGTNNFLVYVIQAETEAFFEGQKSVEEVAKIIQNRIGLYVME